MRGQPSDLSEIFDRQSNGRECIVVSDSEEQRAIQLSKEIGEVKCVGAQWHIYNPRAGVWNPRNEEEFHPKALLVLPEEKRTQRLAKEIVSHLEMRSQVSRDEFRGAVKFTGPDSVLVAVANGHLHISPSGARLINPQSGENFTIALPVDYQPEATSPTFDRVLNEAVPDEEERKLFLDVLATALIPDCRFEAALVAIGEGGTGKSTVAGVLPKIFGPAGASLSMSDLCHPNGYKLALLDRKMINIASELNTLEFEDSGLFKQLISGERFTDQFTGSLSRWHRAQNSCSSPIRCRGSSTEQTRRSEDCVSCDSIISPQSSIRRSRRRLKPTRAAYSFNW